MLLTKRLLNRIRKINWNIILLELFIVFVGVYLAFLLSNYQENKRIEAEANKIYTSLKKELENIRFNFPQRAVYQRSLNVRWDSLWKNNEFPPLYDWRYIQPQYDFTTMEYALQAQSSSIVNFELYESLTNLYQGVKRLEHIEMLITDIGTQCNNVATTFGLSEEEVARRRTDNQLLFYRFKDLSVLRAKELEYLVPHAESSLEIINARLGREKQREIEINLLQDYLPELLKEANLPPERLRMLIQKQFPMLRERDVTAVVEEISPPPKE